MKYNLYMKSKHKNKMIYEFVKYFSYGYKAYEFSIDENNNKTYYAERVCNGNSFEREKIKFPVSLKRKLGRYKND